jgi:glyoxylate reductase
LWPQGQAVKIDSMTAANPLVYVSRLLPDPVMSAIRQRFTLVHEPLDTAPTLLALQKGLSSATAAILTLTDRIDAETIESACDLKILANYAVGYNNIDVEAARRRGVIVTNTPDVLTDATADLTWALILATARRVIEGDHLIRSGQWVGWAPTQLLGAAVAGKTLGIVGMGRIGRAVAERAAGFRMKVLYYSRHPVDAQQMTLPWELRPLRALLAESDFVTIHVPLTAETHHLIGAQQLAQMRRTAILINTARGPIVDEAALAAALRQGKLAGAGLDVFEEEPLVHPDLVRLNQVVLLPHLGSATLAARIEMGMICLKNVEAVLNGQPAPNRVV